MKIHKVKINNHRKGFEVTTYKETLFFPFARLCEDVTDNPVVEAFVSEELGREAVGYFLKDGTEGALHIDSVLDFNNDPAYVRKTYLYKMTALAKEVVKNSKLSKREIARQMKTSTSQLARILDTTNYRKSMDQIVKVLAVCGANLQFTVKAPELSEQEREAIKKKWAEGYANESSNKVGLELAEDFFVAESEVSID